MNMTSMLGIDGLGNICVDGSAHLFLTLCRCSSGPDHNTAVVPLEHSISVSKTVRVLDFF